MYTIKAYTADGEEFWIHNPAVRVLITGDPWYEVGDNINGSAGFVVYPDHPYYDKVKKLTTEITIFKDGEEKFTGRVLYDDEDSAGAKEVFVEGELGYLNDSIQRPAVYHDITLKQYCQTIVDYHNDQVENRKKFVLGTVTVEDSNDSLYRYSNYETTRETFSDKLIDRLGGHLRVRHDAENRILDYLSDDTYYKNATQTIKFGKNLLDYAKNLDATDVVTCLIPLGAAQDEEEIEGLTKYLGIEDVNGGVDYVTDDAAVAEYGRIFGTEHWDDVTVPENLKAKGEEYLKTVQYENLVLELTAVDMNLTDEEVEELEVGDRVRCISEPNNLDAWYPISKMKVHLMDAQENTFTLGTETKYSTYTSGNTKSNAELTRTIEEIPTKGEILKQAMADATDLINQAVASGYAIHEPNEFIVADDIDYKNQAKNLWRWGMGGLAHYSNGYNGEADGIALTMDGHINGKFIMANTVMAESIDFGYTEMIESEISDAKTDANTYTDNTTRAVQETVTNSITNLENRIALSVVSTKEAIVQKNYVTNGETETISLDDFTISGSAAKAELVEHENVNCIKLTFTSSGGVSIQQALGTLPAGNYTVQYEAEYDGDEKTPNYVRVGFVSNYNTVYFSSFDPGVFKCVKQKYEITETSRSFYAYIYGYSGSVVYIKNLRCLRNFQEVLDEVSASLNVAIDEVSARVTQTSEYALHDYCVNGDFSDSSSAFNSWTRGSTTYITSATYSGESCAQLQNSGTSYSLYQKFSNPQKGLVRVKFKAACASGSEDARVRVYVGGKSKYTATGDLTTDWQTFSFDYEDVSAGTVYVYLYNYTSNTTIYITDVEIFGYYSYYADAQLSVVSDSITAEVTRATSAEETLKASIQVNADNITSCVTKGDFGTQIEQNYSHVRIAWNSYTKYIQFENAKLDIYDSSNTLLMALSSSGQRYYYSGNEVGSIGTSHQYGYTSHRGLQFILEYSSGYMCWAAYDSSSASTPIMKLYYEHKTTTGSAIGLHLGCALYAHYYGIYLGSNSSSTKVTSLSTYNGEIGAAVGDFAFADENEEIIATIESGISCYSDLNMEGHTVKNTCDERLKTNIKETQVNGLDVVNGIDMAEFDWIESGEHKEIGVIAQQVKEVAPELVSENKEGLLQVSSTDLIFYCLKAIQELSEKLGYYEKQEKIKTYSITSEEAKEKLVKELAERRQLKNIEEAPVPLIPRT